MVYDLRRLISFNNTFNLMGIIFVIRNNLGNDYPCAQTLKARYLIRAIWTPARQAVLGRLQLTKVFLYCATLSCLFYMPLSARSDIIYNVNTNSTNIIFINTNFYGGNTFLTTSTPSKLNSISLYLSQKLGGDTTPLSGAIYLDIYYAKSSSTGLYIADTTTRLARASISPSELSTDIYTSVPTSFTYTGTNAIDLAANTRYAFYLNLTNVSFSGSRQLLCQSNNSSTYSGGNFFGTNFINGMPDADIAGQIDVTYAAVPEPGTMILFGVTMAIGGAVAVIRKRRKRNAD